MKPDRNAPVRANATPPPALFRDRLIEGTLMTHFGPRCVDTFSAVSLRYPVPISGRQAHDTAGQPPLARREGVYGVKIGIQSWPIGERHEFDTRRRIQIHRPYV